jgi:ABC-type glycerol-3-phosphate transport system substrate-binding protein
VWWAQYDGIDTFNKVLQGKDANGNYTADSQKTIGKLSSFSIVSDLLNIDNGYVDPNSGSYSFTDAQVFFLAEQAFMMSTGDWLEREMSTNFSESMEIAFMPIPVNSDVIKNCTSITTDEQLVEVISYIDGEIAEKPAYVNDADLAYIKSARSMYCSEGNQHICYVPAYSNNIDAAKQFIQFMLSKEGQEIMLQYSYGNMAMLNVDIAQFSYYDSLSNLQKSKLQIMQGGDGATFVGKNYVHPMYYAGGMELTYELMEQAFGVVSGSGSYKSARQFWEQEYSRVASNFSNMMSQAGVSN